MRGRPRVFADDKEAAKIRQRRARAKTREFINDLKVKQGCMDCGEKHPACLHFHHIDPSTKLDTISRLTTQQRVATNKLLQEIAKCIVLCANCHAKRHYVEHQASQLPYWHVNNM